MEKQKLQTSLAELHQELSSGGNVDESTRTMLTTLAQDIAQLLESGTGPAAAEANRAEPIAPADKDNDKPATSSDSLQALIVEYEGEYPRLTRILGQLADGLANLGI